MLYIDQPHNVLNNDIETDRRNTRANLADVAPDGYLEVVAPPRMQSKTLFNLKDLHN